MDTREIDPLLETRVRELAEKQKRSADAVVTEAIEQYVTREEARMSFDQEEQESWEDFQKTGLHITGEELFAWLDTWGTDPEKEPPACHT